MSCDDGDGAAATPSSLAGVVLLLLPLAGAAGGAAAAAVKFYNCLLYTSPSPRDRTRSRMPSSA